ncbi:MAG: ORC1-type DNA replication protein [Candidatus Bathyarchaeota archaeon]|nr:ORC1-type DNA replication protein [Candidatus Termiticorpusculum sp.]MCL1970943.1 ORC1-type DNA replication protein [Candidatus Termiticorpusculum sp.]
MMSRNSVFKDESKLDINYLPARLLHRAYESRLLMEFFSFLTRCPGRMAQRVIVTGDVGTGKTALCKFFGENISVEVGKRGVKFRYVHVNCREYRGNLSQILHNAVTVFQPNFPVRGFSAEEILKVLLQILEEEQVFIILALDEFDSLIEKEGSDAVYKLTRLQEMQQDKPQRISFIFIQRNLESLKNLDDSTQSTLQRNIINLERYGNASLIDILNDRVKLAFELATVSEDVISLIAELASAEVGNARFGIELLWRSGKYADARDAWQVEPECVRQAVSAIIPMVKRSELDGLGLHEKMLLLAVARYFKENKDAYATLVEIEETYAVICEEYGEEPYSHTQLWKYIQHFKQVGIVQTTVGSTSFRGRSTMVSLPSIPAGELEQQLCSLFSRSFR